MAAVQLIRRIDLPGVVDVADQWYAVTDAGRTLHIVLGLCLSECTPSAGKGLTVGRSLPTAPGCADAASA